MIDHYSKDEVKLKKAVEKAKISILKKYGDTGYSDFRREIVTKWYDNEKKIMDEVGIISKEDVTSFLTNSSHSRYRGKAGCRRLKKESIQVYKSLNYYCEKFKIYYNEREIPFVCKLDIALQGFNITDSMLCYCKKRLKFDPKTQDWSKLYCMHCRMTGTSSNHFKYKYGDEWERLWHERKLEKNNSAIMRGENEKTMLDEIEFTDNIKIDRNFRVLNFYPDGYCHENNTIYEVYEPHHKGAKYKEKDEIRRHIIQNYLKCNFCVVWDTVEKTKEFYNYV